MLHLCLWFLVRVLVPCILLLCFCFLAWIQSEMFVLFVIRIFCVLCATVHTRCCNVRSRDLLDIILVYALDLLDDDLAFLRGCCCRGGGGGVDGGGSSGVGGRVGWARVAGKVGDSCILDLRVCGIWYLRVCDCVSIWTCCEINICGYSASNDKSALFPRVLSIRID